MAVSNPIKICSVAGCNRKKHCKGFCDSHFYRWKKHGDVMADVPIGKLPTAKVKNGPCTVDGCNFKQQGQGLCSAHYARFKKHGDPKAHIPIRHVRGDVPCKVDGCNKSASYKAKGSLGYCMVHAARYSKHGNPNIVLRTFGKPIAFLKDLVENPRQGCVFWPFAANKSGYGNISKSYGTGMAHRLALILKLGEPPFDTAQALHKCGNGHKGCVNPECLYWGTSKDNSRDAEEHGTICRGESIHNSKLSESDVLSIYNDPRRPFEIAADYPVKGSHISSIKNGKAWNWLTKHRK